MNTDADRRKFLKFLGYGAVTGWIPLATGKNIEFETELIQAIEPSSSDKLVLSNGLSFNILIKWRDSINTNEKFGANNDFIAFLSEDTETGILWVNHESFRPALVSGAQRTKENVDIERKEVGGSILKVKRSSSRWVFVPDDKINRRIDATMEIPFTANAEIRGEKTSEGTVANCAGGTTPWGTFLSCEENYHSFYGDYEVQTNKIIKSKFRWEKFYPNPPEHYGWVVEIDPYSGNAKKHISLGRFSHESATCIQSHRGNTVVYSGDDKVDECLYKFISDNPHSLETGTLYVADIINGKWLPLDWQTQSILKKHFANQLEVFIHTRYAAKLLGGTPLDRPEDIKINPVTGDVFISLTNNLPKANFHGQIIKIVENNGDYESLEFSTDTFLTGGRDGFSSPDNLLFDKKGNLWFCSDVSGKAMHKPPYLKYKNNGLFLVQAQGPQAGQTIQIASAPTDAEFTGLCFDPDQTTLFVSVQHPGDLTVDKSRPTSRWPDGRNLPASAVVQISGPLLTTVIDNQAYANS